MLLVFAVLVILVPLVLVVWIVTRLAMCASKLDEILARLGALDRKLGRTAE